MHCPLEAETFAKQHWQLGPDVIFPDGESI